MYYIYIYTQGIVCMGQVLLVSVPGLSGITSDVDVRGKVVRSLVHQDQAPQ